MGPRARAIYAGLACQSVDEIEQSLVDIPVDYYLGVSSTPSGGDQFEADALILALHDKAPTLLARWIRQPSFDNGQRGSGRDVRAAQVYWRTVRAYDVGSIPPALVGAVALAVSDELAAELQPAIQDTYTSNVTTSEALDRFGLAKHPEIWLKTLLVKVDVLRATHYGLDAHGLASAKFLDDIERLVSDQASDLVGALPWLLAAKSPTASSVATTLVLTSPEAFDALEELSTSPHDPALNVWASGLNTILQSGTPSAVSDLARWTVDNNQFIVPRPLDAPSATWMGNPTLEDSLRAAINNAAESVNGRAMPLEQEVCSRLVTTLMDRLDKYSARSPHGNPGMSLDYVFTTPPKENVNGCDIALTIAVEMAGKLRTRKAHLVQVKRANQGTRETAPKWLIDVEQLDKIIKHDEGATYWLLSDRPGAKVLCVPATFIEGLVDGKRKRGQTLTLNYDQHARNAAIPLGQLVVDLLLGLWLGSRRPGVLKIADGDDTGYLPENLLHLTLRFGGG